MKRLAIVLSALLALCSVASATTVTLTGAGKPSAAAPTYTGPGDLSINSNVVAWWGFRCYSSTYTGNVAAITDSVTSKTTTLHCTSGTLDVVAGNDTLATLKTNCATSGHCTLNTFYDQSGKTNCGSSAACNFNVGATIVVLSSCPSFTATYKFCLVTNWGSSDWMFTSALTSAIPQPYAMIEVSYRTAETDIDQILRTSGDGSFLGYDNVATQFRWDNSGGAYDLIPSGATLSTWYSLGGSDTGTTMYFQPDSGTTSSGATITNSLSGNIQIGAYSSDQTYVEEGGIWSADIHSSFSAYYSNASGYLGGM